jgi:hypothetical protein
LAEKILQEAIKVDVHNYLYQKNSAETSAKREFSAVAILFSFAFSPTVVYHGIDNG